ncbi:hypothetical protein [Mycoplana ramosa]|uniref:Uncharacterized protein n=1 Tax=Mycoplana ramosa TaxID=40837 RepID=A0ABW3YWH8_MYCRA
MQDTRTPKQKARTSAMARDLVDIGEGAIARDLIRRGYSAAEIETLGEAAMAEAANLFSRAA